METYRDLLGVNVLMKDTQQDAKSFHYYMPPHEVTHLVIISNLPALHTALLSLLTASPGSITGITVVINSIVYLCF